MTEMQLLGSLEQKVMTVLWRLGRGTVRDVLDNFTDTKKPAYTTLMTVMVRLADKRLLQRSPHGNAFMYEPSYSEEGLRDEASRRAVRDVLERFGTLAVDHFLEEASLTDEQRRQLRDLTRGAEDTG